MILIYKAKDITEAHIILGLLETYEIEGYVGGHYLQGGVGEAPAIDTATIFVSENDVEQARQIIAVYESQDYDSDESTAHEEYNFGRRETKSTSSLSRLIIIILMVLAVLLLLKFKP